MSRLFNQARKRPSSKPVHRHGMALLVVVVLVMLVSLAGYRYSFEMENEYRLTRLQEEQVQARLCAQSGIEFAASLLEQPLQMRQSILGGEEAPQVFSRVVEQSNLVEKTLTQDRSDYQWRFAIVSGGGGSGLGAGPGESSAGSQSIATASEPVSNTASWGWGFESEGAKLHIPSLLRWNQMRPGLAREVLLTLPEADEETVDGWLATLGVRTATTAAQDAMQMAMEGGMQSNMQRQQRSKSLEKLRLRWLGGDLDQNYRLDPWEETLMERILSSPGVGEATTSPMARELSKVNSIAMGQGVGQGGEGQGPVAWNRYLTWVQGERNERPNGKPRIWLNQPDLRRLHQELSEVMTQADANFIIAFRQNGPGANPSRPRGESGIGGAANPRPVAGRGVAGMEGSASALPSGALRLGSSQLNSSLGSIDWQRPSKYLFKSPVELVEATLSIESSTTASGAGTKSSRQTISSPFSAGSSDLKGRLAKLLGETTVNQQPIIEGRVDITMAPGIVLAAVPGMTQELAQKVVQARQENGARQEAILSIGWLVEKGVVDWTKLSELEPHITTRSDVFSLQSVGFRDDRTPVFRSTVMIDARQIPAQVRDLRVWHPWNRGFTTEVLTQSAP
ncbi:MAG: hypothetical protein ACOYKN_16415 [Pirellula sp.]